MFYEKKIKYLDYLVGGEKKRGAGFVKTEVRDKDLRLYIKINGIYTAKPLETDIVFKGAGKSTTVRKIRLNNGVGDSGEIRLNASHMGGNLSYGELERIEIPLSEKCMIVCAWKQPDGRKEEQPTAVTRQSGAEAYGEDQEKQEKKTHEMLSAAEKRNDPECKTEEFAKQDPERELKEESEVQDREHIPEYETGSRRVGGFEKYEKTPYEDKWRQLASIYPHMDMPAEISDCITIKPADFVIFPGKYYSLVTNSFLLHGYHNYGHLVLARTEKRGEIRYYIGVPGVFFDKERQVALMFGFESFECGKDFAENGDYGYYMIRVEL